MHTATELTSSSFLVRIDGEERDISALLPGFARHDRLGLVIDQPLGGIGASTLVLAATTAFYDVHRARSAGFFIYPDFFTFHVGGRYGDHGMFDVWPDHKEVQVDREPEDLLRAINDRGITRLVVPAGEEGSVEEACERHTVASAFDRVVSGYGYSPTGWVVGGGVEIRGDAITESYVAEAVRRSGDDSDRGAQVLAARASLHVDGRPVERYVSITPERAVGMAVSAARNAWAG